MISRKFFLSLWIFLSGILLFASPILFSVRAETGDLPHVPTFWKIFDLFPRILENFENFDWTDAAWLSGAKNIDSELEYRLQATGDNWVMRAARSWVQESGVPVALIENGKIALGLPLPTSRDDADPALLIQGNIRANELIGDGSRLTNVGHWKQTEGEDDIWYTAGKIGIGTKDPEEMLDVAVGNLRVNGELQLSEFTRLWSDLSDRIRSDSDLLVEGNLDIVSDLITLGRDSNSKISLQDNPLSLGVIQAKSASRPLQILRPENQTLCVGNDGAVSFLGCFGSGIFGPPPGESGIGFAPEGYHGGSIETPALFLTGEPGEVDGEITKDHIVFPGAVLGESGVHRTASKGYRVTVKGNEVMNLWPQPSSTVVMPGQLILGEADGENATSPYALDLRGGGDVTIPGNMTSVGNITSSGVVTNNWGDPLHPNLSSGADTDTGFVGWATYGSDFLSTGGVERMRIQQNGGIGIGTAAADGVALQVSGNIRANSVDLSGNSLTGLASPTSSADAASKAYLESTLSSPRVLNFTILSTDPPKSGTELCAAVGETCLMVLGRQGTGEMVTSACSLSASDYSGLAWCQ